MLKLGLTSTSFAPLFVRESGQSINFDYDNKVIKQKSYFGQHNFSIIGINKKAFSLEFENLEKAEFESLKVYVIPFVAQECYVDFYNEEGISNYSAFSFVEMIDINFNYNQTKYSFKLNIYEV